MVVNPGLPQQKRRNIWKWFSVFLLMGLFFMLIFTVFLIRNYQKREVITKTEIIINESAINITASSAESSYNSAISSYLTRYSSSASSSSQSSSLVSILDYINKESERVRQSLIPTTTPTTTTTLNFDYTSYRIKVPTKFKYCNPLSRFDENGIIIPGDTCMAINSSCCPCSVTQTIDGREKTITYGGKIDAINAKYYDTYYSDWLRNCTGFGVVCRMASTGAGCNWNTACVGGICQLVSRY